MHIIKIDDLSTDFIFDLFYMAHLFETKHSRSTHLIPYSSKKILYNLFYEPSTRTSSSFSAAMLKLGGSVISVNSVQYSSVVKGEDFSDTIITVGTYSDVIVLRHPTNGMAQIASSVSIVPIINAGDGTGEHPTQTLLDAYTIWRKNLWQNDIEITMMGDLKNGRTIHSLARLIARLPDAKINFVAPEDYQIPKYILEDIQENVLCYLCDDLNEVAHCTDVLYLTRVQQERGSKFSYGLSDENIERLNPNAIVMHPFPRNSELPSWFDKDPRAAYFDQMKNGLWVRMALLEKILENEQS